MKTITLNQIIEINKKELNVIFFKIIKKIKEKQIEQTNLVQNRNKFELLLDVIVESILELIIKNQLKKNLKITILIYIDYEDIRIEDGKYPDLFDLIIVEKNNIENIITKFKELKILDNEEFENNDNKKYGLIKYNKNKIKLNDFFEENYKNILLEKDKKKKYLLENSNIKDIHTNVFYVTFKDKEEIKKYDNIESIKKIDLFQPFL